MMSPTFLVFVSLVFTSAMLAVIFYIAWRTQGRQPHILSWALTFLVATFLWIFSLLNERFPNDDAYWISVNALALLAVTFAVRGHCLRVGKIIDQKLLWGMPAAVLALVAWFTVAHPHMGLRMSITPAYAAFILSFCGYCILRFSAHPRPDEWVAASTLIVFALSQFAAAGAAAIQGSNVVQTYMDIYLAINFIALPAAFTGTGMFVVFMVASDLSAELKEQAVRDQLTGLYNRRGFTETAAVAYANARRTDRPVSVIMTDIDRFKSINDEFGHAAGDEALAYFAKLLTQDRRANDILARVGGEEFALVLPGTVLEDSILIADDLCRRLERWSFQSSKGPLQMTASFGVATISVRDTCIGDVIARADKALYRSKSEGRNRVDLESSQIIKIGGGLLGPAARA